MARGATWPYWVVPMVVVVGLLWYFLADRPQTVEPVVTFGKLTHFAAVPDDWTSIGGTLNDYVGREIYSRAGENLGTVRDILVGPDGKMAAALKPSCNRQRSAQVPVQGNREKAVKSNMPPCLRSRGGFFGVLMADTEMCGLREAHRLSDTIL